ncbi:MAG: hypothetical protein HeimC2_12420 [Candidatus Heimdallarchaeota archaeon LC_2]|nr:MAG: hypothetical protein HeimC2_12420 [Candidatus Heimdallarchaeota archaeon LC_2]
MGEFTKIICWKDRLRQLRQLRLINEYKGITYVSVDSKITDRQRFHDQQVCFNISNKVKRSMLDMTQIIISRIVTNNPELENIDIYFEGLNRNSTSNKYLNTLKRMFRKDEYYQILSKFLLNIDEVQVQKIFSKINAIDGLNILEKIMATHGLLNQLNESQITSIWVRNILDEMIENCVKIDAGDDHWKYKYLIKGYQKLMYHMINTTVEESFIIYLKQNELNKLHGNRLDGLDIGIEYLCKLDQQRYHSVIKQLAIQLETEFNSYCEGGLYNNKILVDRGEIQITAIRKFFN